MPDYRLPSDDVLRLLREVISHFDNEDKPVRERQLLVWRQLKLCWDGLATTYYSEVAHDWRIFDPLAEGDNSDQGAYDKPVNVFRAYLESIIAALSITIPPIKCFPDDADNTLDLSTARAGDKIAQLIYRHNDVALLWLHALFVYCTEGMVAAYHRAKPKKEYGTYKIKKYDDVSELHSIATCPNCGYQLSDEMMSPEDAIIQDKLEQSIDEFQPEDVAIQDFVLGDEDLCPACAQMMIPQITQQTLVVEKLVGETDEVKSRMCIEAYGGLNVKVPNYARKQEDCPYLAFSYEEHYSVTIGEYEHLHGKITKATIDKLKGSTGVRDPYEEWARLSPQYRGDYPTNTITKRHWWIRPDSFYVLAQLEDVKRLKRLYPNGVLVILANDEFCKVCNRSLDDDWTLTYNPLSDFIHFDPAGLLLVSLQEITNDILSLTIQTIEQGIGQTFADPGVLDFDAYRQQESIPGGIYEAIPKSGKSIGDAFHEVKTATLSPEVMPFAQNVQSLAQLVSGALPSLFGGAIEGSETASQYSMSRAQALQRQQNTWKMFCAWWKNIFGKAIPAFIKEIKDDERDVQKDKNGQFFNVFIRKAEMEGKIGRIELEASENLPITWSQQKDIVEKLLLAGNPEILAILGAPENLPLIREALGLSQFYVPGEDDVIKQYDEIKLLLNSIPMPSMDPMNPEGEESSVPIDPIYDNHGIEFEIVRKWVISEAGRQAKEDNPEGYRNVLLHGQMHMMQMQMQQMAAQPADGAEGNELTEDDQEAPITEESNVATV